MEATSVRKVNWLAIISLILEAWGLLTSFLFVTLFISPGYVFSLGAWANDWMLSYYALFNEILNPVLASTLLGVAGILLSSLVLNWKGRVSRLAVAGVLLGILVILCGFPSILLLIRIYGA